jgi:hypothetical protein
MKNVVFWDIYAVRTSQETHYVSTAESSQLMLCKIWGFDNRDYEECRLLGYIPSSYLTEDTLSPLQCWAVTMKNAVFWDVAPYGSYKNRRFGGTYRLHLKGEKNQQPRNNVGSYKSHTA